MTNQPTEHSRSGRTLDLRGSGSGRSVRAIVALLGLLAIASTAGAAEIVEVRVGRHPDFTRIVFELDRAAGYRIERSDPSSKNAELIVSLEAGSIPRRIQSSKSFIEQVVVEPSGGRSIARIRLAQGGLKLKEMILASPPRIVLDVISESAATSGVTTTTAKSTAPATAPATAPSAAAKPPSVTTSLAASTNTAADTAADTTASSGTTAAMSAKPGNVVPAPAPKTKVLASTGPSGSKPPAPNTPAAGQSAAPTASSPAAPPAGGSPGSVADMALAQNDAGSAPSEWSDGANGMPGAEGAAGASDAAGLPGTDTPAAADAAARANERPMMVKSSEADRDGEGGGLLNWALVGAGLAVVAFGGLVLARRRRAAALGDDDAEQAGEEGEEEATSPFFEDRESDDEEAEDEEAEEEQTQPASSSNPFAGLSGGAVSFGAEKAREATRPVRGADRPAEKHPADKQEKKPSESLLFDDAEETKMEGMEVISRSQANELGGAMPMMGAGSDELTQMFREMQRRVAALESRIDELVDARDRLERQVAAQTEELRVQRAAIARTQRAVRNLARPEDGSDDEPTEPALREPN